LLEAKLGAGRVLARTGEWQLYVLNQSASMLWELHEAGWGTEEMASLVEQYFGLDVHSALAQVDSLISQWHQAGLIDAKSPGIPSENRVMPDSGTKPAPADVSGESSGQMPETVATRPYSGLRMTLNSTALPPSHPFAKGGTILTGGVMPGWKRNHSPIKPQAACYTLAVAGMCLRLAIDDAELARYVAPVVESLIKDDANSITHHLHLVGCIANWILLQDGIVKAQGQGTDEALVMTVRTLVESGCRLSERMMVIHGAGLSLGDGVCLLLIAPGGSGKTTLAAALNAAGYGLLSDDVVPVTPGGELVGLGMPLCLKAGSWPVLSSRRPDLAAAATVQRYGEPVRYLPPCGQRVEELLRLGLLLFPRYQPGSIAGFVALTPEDVLQRVVEADAVIRDLTQQKLEAIVRWASSAPAYALTYPDLQSGLELVRVITSNHLDGNPCANGFATPSLTFRL